jgi:hypothetical protein
MDQTTFFLLNGGAGSPPEPPAAPVGLLVPTGPYFTLRGQPWRYKGVSAFKLCHRFSAGEDIEPFLHAYLGFNVLRVWDYVTWEGTGWESNTADEWIAFIAYVGHRGWWVELTLLTDDDPARIGPAERMVNAISGSDVDNVLLEAGNEPTTHKHIDTAALEPALEASGFPYCSGDYEDSDRWYGTYYVNHTARTVDWCRRSHDLMEFYDGTGPDKPTHPHHVPCLGDEPGKVQDVGPIVTEWRAYFGGCSIMGAGATFHSETGKFAMLPTPMEQALAGQALFALDTFPADTPGGPYRRIVESGQPPDARTYIVGNCAVRSQQVGTAFPEPGWRALDHEGVLWMRP